MNCEIYSQTVEREKPKRRKRGDLDKNMFDGIESSVSGGHSADNSMENDPDDDEDLMPPPTPGTQDVNFFLL